MLTLEQAKTKFVEGMEDIVDGIYMHYYGPEGWLYVEDLKDDIDLLIESVLWPQEQS